MSVTSVDWIILSPGFVLNRAWIKDTFLWKFYGKILISDFSGKNCMKLHENNLAFNRKVAFWNTAERGWKELGFILKWKLYFYLV